MPESRQTIDAGPSATYLADLNPPQRAAVEALDGPVLVLAGAGTGKTRVLTTRLAHLLFEGRARPWQVLAVTFTNRAAQEMRARVAGMVGGPADAIWLGTFHAMGVRILRRHAERVGLAPNFTILDEDDQIRLLKQVLAAENIDDKKWPARVLLAAIQRWKDRGLAPGKVSTADAGDLAGGRLAEIYAAYQSRLATLNTVDFGDLLLHCLTLFTGHDEVLADYQERFHYILVDEYQDTNVAQYLLLRLLAQKRRNIACVGDDDQSIYAWRGAEVGNILRFETDFPGAKVIRLEQKLPLHPAHPGCRLRPHRQERRPPGQDLVDGRRRRRQGRRARRLGRRGGGARGRRCDRGTAAPGARASPTSPSWCAPDSRRANSRSGF